MEKKKIYIAVKTYPNISKEYSELVCTAGFSEDGSWIRLYPVPFRKLDFEQKYKKYPWIEAFIERRYQDFRPESYSPQIDTITVYSDQNREKVDWQERKDIIFKKEKVFTNLDELISKAKNRELSLAIFKPTKIIDLKTVPTDSEWDIETLKYLENKKRQLTINQTIEEIENEFKVVRKVPFDFKYHFVDDFGKESTMSILDWEIGMLYFNCLDKTRDQKTAITKVKDKYLNEFASRDIYFFLGTTLSHHGRARNPFTIIGVFYPPFWSGYMQPKLF
jgi:hypothetical protein